MINLEDLNNPDVWKDADLRELGIAVLTEIERRELLASAEQRIEQVQQAYATAIGRVDGDAWGQPAGAHDAYATDALVVHNGKTWRSLTPNNVWEPGVSGWREEIPEPVEGEDPPAPAEFVQPTGAHDAYKKGDVVTFEGAVYSSLMDGNVYSPSAYPQGWQEL